MADPEVNERGNSVYRDLDADEIIGGRGGDRYRYDFELCSKEKGWRQFDTTQTQDAHYFGVWVNVESKKVFTYCEGDRILVDCQTIENLRAELASMVKFYGNAPPAFIKIAGEQVTEYFDQRPSV